MAHPAFYLLVDVMLGVTAYLTRSIVPGLVVHSIGLLTFFTLVWPYDTHRRLVWDTGADTWFWLHVAQAVLFTALALLAFSRLARVTTNAGPPSDRPSYPLPWERRCHQ